jgi:cobalamin biosynthesis protein CobD/CbiB
VWRRLKRLGAAQLLDGLVALPLDARNREQLEWVADDIAEAGGQATMWVGRLASRADERSIVRDLADAVAVQYRKLIAEARIAGAQEDVVRRRTLARLRRELRRIGQRDYFPPSEAEQARAAVESLAAVEEVPA